jgi:polyphosphate kinase
VTALFNRLTGYAPKAGYKKLLVAPEHLRDGITQLIDREIDHAKAGHHAYIIIKINSLIDTDMTRKLYKASQAGVKIDMIVRGICGLRPGIPNLSENIHVRSIIGRFLEHSRIFYFWNNGQTEIYMGSADLMGRNLDRRVETVFPVEDETIKNFLLKDILEVQLADNKQARVLQSDGTWIRLQPKNGEVVLDCQHWTIGNRRPLE